jgi:hypothetical protein
MFGKSEKIFNVYEKPESAEPTERVVLLREGFSFWAFSLNALWLLANRMWLVFAGYLALSVIVTLLAQTLHLSEISTLLLQLWLQMMLGYHARDLEAYNLRRKGYRLAGVLAAESEMMAQRRYYEFAA